MKKGFLLLTYLLFSNLLRAQNSNSFSSPPYDLTPFEEEGKFGYKNASGQIEIEPKFEFAVPFYNRRIAPALTLTVAKFKNSWVLINNKGDIIKKLKVDEISLKLNINSWVYKKNNKYGLIYFDGNFLTEAIYDFIIPAVTREGGDENYRNGGTKYELANSFIFKLNGKIGFGKIIRHHEKKGEIVEILKPGNYKFLEFNISPINIDFDNPINSCLTWGGKLGSVSFEKRFLIQDLEKNNFIIFKDGLGRYPESIPITSSVELDSITPSQKTILLTTKDDYGDKQKSLLPPSDNIRKLNEIAEIRRVKKNGKWGAISEEQLLDLSSRLSQDWIYDFIGEFGKYSAAVANLGGKSGIITPFGIVIVDFKYDKIIPLGSNYFALQNKELWSISFFDKILIENISEYKRSSNFWLIKVDGYWNIYSLDGKLVDNTKYYSKIFDFEEYKFSTNDPAIKLAKVLSPNKLMGLVDENFKQVIPPNFDDIITVETNTYRGKRSTFAFVKKDNKYGSLDFDLSNQDNIYTVPANFSTVNEVKSQIVKNMDVYALNLQKIEQARKIEADRQEKIEIARKIEEAKVAKLEAARIAKEEKLKAARNAQAQKKNLESLQSLQNLSNYLENLERASVAKRRQGRTVNAWQCRYCGVLSRSEEEPCCGKFGDCPSADSHSFAEANTNKGLQCTKCGKTSYILLNGRIPEEPCCGEFRECTYGDHNWRHF
jgi:hypothetical protein